jgi:hypothetical protein
VHTREEVGHPSLEFFSDELPEKKLQLVDMSILSILLSPRPGCHLQTIISYGEKFQVIQAHQREHARHDIKDSRC